MGTFENKWFGVCCSLLSLFSNVYNLGKHEHTILWDLKINIMEVRVFAEWTNMKNGYRHLSISIDSLF